MNENNHGGKRENSGRPYTGKVQLRYWTFKGNDEKIKQFIKELESKKPLI